MQLHTAKTKTGSVNHVAWCSLAHQLLKVHALSAHKRYVCAFLALRVWTCVLFPAVISWEPEVRVHEAECDRSHLPLPDECSGYH